MLRLSILFFSVFSFINVYGADLDLQTALREVIGDSPSLERSKSIASEAHWKKTEAFGQGFMPKLKANGNYLTNKKYQFINVNLNGAPIVIPNIVPNSQFNLIAEIPIFDGLISTQRVSAASKFAEAADEKYNWEKFRTEMTVTLAFYQALGSKLLKEVADQNMKVLEDHKKETQLFRKSGVSTNYDVLRVEVQASNGLTDQADADDEIILSKRKLAEVLGHDMEDRDLTGDLPVPRPEIIAQVNQQPLERGDIKAMRLESIAAGSLESAAGRYWVPEFSFFTTYSMYNNLSTGMDDWGSYRNSRQVGFQMNWNLFDGLVSHSRSKQQIEKKVQAEKTLRSAQLAAGKDLDVWTRRYLSQCRIYQARVEDIKRSEESVRLAKAGKRVGARTDSELLDSELDLYRSRAGAVRAQLAAVEALVNLQLANGRRY
jgi:outer membrane protein TolC